MTILVTFSFTLLRAQSDYSSAYVISTLAGSGAEGSADGTGTAASFRLPFGVAVDADGNVFVADTDNHKIRKISPAGEVTTFAGSGFRGSADGTGAAASFHFPTGVAVDAGGDVFVADGFNHKIRKISPAGEVTTFAGSGSRGSADGTGGAASFDDPSGVAVGAGGNLYVADSQNCKIRKISPAGVVTTLAGSGAVGSTDGAGAAARFRYPCGVAVDAGGNVFVADQHNHKIRKVSPAGVVTTLAGSVDEGDADGTGAAASFRYPTGVAVDAGGNVFVADYGNFLIRKISQAGVVGTVAGPGEYFSADDPGAADGTGAAASLNDPTGVAVDVGGNLYIAENGYSKIRKGVPALVQYIAFPGLVARSTASSPFDLTASASSGLPVSFNLISGPATLSGKRMTLKGAAGTVVVRATQSGNAAYASAPHVERSFVVKASTISTLSNLVVQGVTLSPKFAASAINYTAKVGNSTRSIKITTTAKSNATEIAINGVTVKSGTTGKAIALRTGKNVILIVVTAQNGSKKTYKITVMRANRH